MRLVAHRFEASVDRSRAGSPCPSVRCRTFSAARKNEQRIIRVFSMAPNSRTVWITDLGHLFRHRRERVQVRLRECGECSQPNHTFDEIELAMRGKNSVDTVEPASEHLCRQLLNFVEQTFGDITQRRV